MVERVLAFSHFEDRSSQHPRPTHPSPFSVPTVTHSGCSGGGGAVDRRGREGGASRTPDELTGLLGRERERRREVRPWKGRGPLGWPGRDAAL